MKKLVAMITLLAMLVSMVGCAREQKTTETAEVTQAVQATDEQATEPTKEAATEQAVEKKVIGVSLPSPDNQWVGAVIDYAKQAAATDTDLYDIKIVVSDSPTAQTAAIEDLMQEKLDVLVVLPVESAPLTPICEQAYDAGIKLLVVDRGISSDKYTAFLAGDNYGIGVSAANYIGEKLNGKGNVVEILGVPCEIVTQRSNGFNETIKEKYPDIKVIAQATGNFSREDSLTAMEDILEAQDDIDAVYSHDDEQTLGISLAVKNAGRESEMFVTGAGGNKSIFEAIKGGDSLTPATFIYLPQMGGTAIEIAKAMASGDTLEKAASNDVWLDLSLKATYGSDYLTEIGTNIPKDIILTAETVTAENVDDFYDPNSNY